MRLTRILLGGILLVATRFRLVVVYGIRPYCNSITRPGTSRLEYGGEVSAMIVFAALVIDINVDMMVDSTAWVVVVVGLLVMVLFALPLLLHARPCKRI